MNSHFVEETEPLLGGTTEILNGHQQQQQHRRRCQAENASSSSDTLVDFDPKGDSENPQEWPKPFKWGITMLLTLMGFAVTFNCVGVVPVASRISADLSHGTADKSASVLLVTIWELGEAAGPLLIAPLSETVGRYPVINVCTTLFVLATAGAALSRSTAAFVTARLLSGLFVTSNVLNPAVVGDIFGPEDRGSPMSLCLLSPLIGGAVGPAISGAVAETLSWRWALWIAAGLAALCELLFLTCFRETYRAAILKKRAKTSGGAEHVDGERGLRGLLEAVARPGFVFRSSGVLMALSLYGSVIFAQFYVVSVTLPDILTEIYGLSPAQTGFGLMSFSVGSSASLVFCNTFLDRIYVKLRASNGGRGLPEHRLPISIAGGLALPLAMAAYGWIAHLALPLWALLLSVMVFGNALMLANVPLSAYVVDAFGAYSASAMTGLIVARCLMGTFLPLLTTPLIEGFGRGWAFTVLAGANLVLAPVPMLVFRYGERWRRGSKYTRDA